ncbi:MAG: transposase [Nitrososphaerota archaeon]|nr:transposase [Nitrososphaerota archaeon]
MGLEALATLSNGEKIPPPRLLRRAETRLAWKQRRHARKRLGSGKLAKSRRGLATCHRRVRDRRLDFAHKLSRDLVNRFDLVAFEDLHVDRLVRGFNSRAVHDAGWGQLRSLTEYKAALGSRYVVRVPANGTTQTCSVCGRVAERPMTLTDRVFRCPDGHELDRDVNAARNILQRGLDELRASSANVTPQERRPPPSRRSRRVYSRRGELAQESAWPSGPGSSGAEVLQQGFEAVPGANKNDDDVPAPKG